MDSICDVLHCDGQEEVSTSEIKVSTLCICGHHTISLLVFWTAQRQVVEAISSSILSWWDLRCENRQVISGERFFFFSPSLWLSASLIEVLCEKLGNNGEALPHPSLPGQCVPLKKKQKMHCLDAVMYWKKGRCSVIKNTTISGLQVVFALELCLWNSACHCPEPLCKLLVLQESVEVCRHGLHWAQGRIRLCNIAHTPLPQWLFYSHSIEWKRHLGEAYPSQYSTGVVFFMSLICFIIARYKLVWYRLVSRS